jgi:hypothetical protein
MQAGVFADTLRQLRRAPLYQIRQLSSNQIDTAYSWLEEYELKLAQYTEDLKAYKERNNAPVPQKVNPTPPATQITASLSDKVYLVALQEYVRMAGPMGDPVRIHTMAQGVRKAYVESA